MVDLYKSIGYKVLMTSTYNMTGIDDLRHVLQHKVTALRNYLVLVRVVFKCSRPKILPDWGGK